MLDIYFILFFCFFFTFKELDTDEEPTPVVRKKNVAKITAEDSNDEANTRKQSLLPLPASSFDYTEDSEEIVKAPSATRKQSLLPLPPSSLADAESPQPQIKVAPRRRAGRIVIDSDDDLPPPLSAPFSPSSSLRPPPSRKTKPQPKFIAISDDSEEDSEKENNRTAINRPKTRISKRESLPNSDKEDKRTKRPKNRISKRESISDSELSRTKQILKNARKRFESSDSEPESDSESESEYRRWRRGSDEGRGDWIRSDEDVSEDEDEDGDLSGFVVPDDEVSIEKKIEERKH